MLKIPNKLIQIVFIVAAFFGAALAAQEQRPLVAVLDPVSNQNISEIVKMTVAGTLEERIVGSKRYRVVDRVRTAQILTEHAFARNGLVDNSQAKEIGKMLQADIVCVSELQQDEGVFLAKCSLIDVVSGEVFASSTELIQADSAVEIKSAIERAAMKLLGVENPKEAQAREQAIKELAIRKLREQEEIERQAREKAIREENEKAEKERRLKEQAVRENEARARAEREREAREHEERLRAMGSAPAGQNTQTRFEAPTEFYEDWDVMPINFKGDDIAALTNALGVEKGEYESTAAYNDKLKSIAESKEKWVFAIRSADSDRFGNGGISLKYEPDKEQYDIIIQCSGGSSKNIIPILPYDGLLHKYYIEIDNNISNNNISFERLVLKTNFKISPAEAPKYKNKIKALAVVKSVPKTNDYIPSTGFIESIIGRRSNIYLDRNRDDVNYLNTHLEAIWIYEEVSGKIIEKIYPENFAKPIKNR
ncbi:MAG: hypothetical protein LBQ86_03640 [Holophagales bacterium]|jgi:superoxide dismutase|nr:hypothetical protein [Holophagales bacterium]